jgi:hypothetical protein
MQCSPAVGGELGEALLCTASLRALFALPLERSWSGRVSRVAHDWAAAALRLLTAALVTMAEPWTAWRHRCSGASRRAFARGRTLKSQPSFREDNCDCAEAAPSCPRGACGGSMLLGASKQGNAIYCAMTTPVYCDGPERQSTALAMSGGRKKRRCPRQQRRTHSTILISEARFSRA